ncbi:MAG: hypothetical protein IJA34_09125 [Lachnospiraceae bacterium]|nr:hypothetical protein [Lachnospiraceae bacterium]
MKKLLTFKNLFLYYLKLAKVFGVVPAFHVVWMQFFFGIRYKHNYILKYLEKNYSSIIEKYKSIEQDDSVIQNDSTIWVCWFQGEERMPRTIKHCYESIKKYSGGKSVQLITLQNYREFISLPNHVVEKVENGTISLTHFSDIIRCNLLADYGGIYVDAGLLLTANLQIPQLPFYSIKKRKPEGDDSFVSDYRWVAGFMAGVKRNVLHLFMKDFLNAYHCDKNMLLDYFLVDYIIAMAYNNFSDVKKMIDDVPYNNEDIYYIQNHLCEPLNKGELDRVLANTSVFRIGYKGIPQEINDDSLYAYLFK